MAQPAQPRVWPLPSLLSGLRQPVLSPGLSSDQNHPGPLCDSPECWAGGRCSRRAPAASPRSPLVAFCHPLPIPCAGWARGTQRALELRDLKTLHPGAGSELRAQGAAVFDPSTLTWGCRELGAHGERAEGGSGSQKRRRQVNTASVAVKQGTPPPAPGPSLSPGPLSSSYSLIGQPTGKPEEGAREEACRWPPGHRAGGRRGNRGPVPSPFKRWRAAKNLEGNLFQGVVGVCRDTECLRVSASIFLFICVCI